MKNIEVKCEGKDALPLGQLIPSQGKLKTLTERNYEKLKSVLLELGICEPITVWYKDGRYLVANGHQRLHTLRQMQLDGYGIPYIPVNYCFPDNATQFAKIILSLTSQYGEIDKEGTYEYMSVNNIPFEWVEGRIRWPEIKMPEFKFEFFKDLNLQDNGQPYEADLNSCPRCGLRFHRQTS